MGGASRVCHGNTHLQSITGLEAQGSAEGRRVGIGTGSHSHLEQGETEQAIHTGQQGCWACSQSLRGGHGEVQL